MPSVAGPQCVTRAPSLRGALVVCALAGVLGLGCGAERDPVPSESAQGRTTQSAKPIPCPEPEVRFDGTVEPGDARFDARALLGMTEEKAVARARREGCVVRVAMRDGRGLDLTADEKRDRVDVYLEDGVVVKVEPS